MRKFSLVISDVDGTLVPKDKRLTDRTVAAVRRLHERGIGFSICSSRPPFGLRMMIEPLGLKLPFGGYNAGAIVEPDLTVVEQKVIGPDAVGEAVGLFRQNGIDCWIFTGNEWRIANPMALMSRTRPARSRPRPPSSPPSPMPISRQSGRSSVRATTTSWSGA